MVSASVSLVFARVRLYACLLTDIELEEGSCHAGHGVMPRHLRLLSDAGASARCNQRRLGPMPARSALCRGSVSPASITSSEPPPKGAAFKFAHPLPASLRTSTALPTAASMCSLPGCLKIEQVTEVGSMQVEATWRL